MKTFLVVTYQPSAAENFVPVCSALAGRAAVTVVCSTFSVSIWETGGFTPYRIIDTAGPQQAQEIIEKSKPDVVLTGTTGIEDLEKSFIHAAKKEKIPSCSFVDFWAKYEQRFTYKDKICVPDKILLLDRTMYDCYCALGFDRNILVVVGSPYFEKLAGMPKKNNNAGGRAAIVFSFFSQPLSQVYRNDDCLGYDETSILKTIIRELKNHLAGKNIQIDFLIKPHPRDRRDMFIDFEQQGNKKLKISLADMPSEQLINRSDLIIGMTSTALITATILGVPAISCQFGSNGKHVFEGTSTGMVRTFFDPKDFAEFLNAFLTQGIQVQNKRIEYLYKNATSNMLQQLL